MKKQVVTGKGKLPVTQNKLLTERVIGLYRDVWIAAIASSTPRLAILSGVMCNTSQCVERNSHCDVLHIAPVRVANLVLDCNGVFAIKAYSVGSLQSRMNGGWNVGLR